jgi:hypothetical protein
MPINHSISGGITLRGASSVEILLGCVVTDRQRRTSTVWVFCDNSVDELSYGGRPSLRRVAPSYWEGLAPFVCVEKELISRIRLNKEK